jgi:carbamoyltransferase
VVASSDLIDGIDRCVAYFCSRVSASTFYLHAFLMNILGISAFYHDAAACLVIDGVVVAAAQEERFSRIKHDPSFPKRSIDYCLKQSGLDPEQIDYIVFYDKPFLKFERLLETYLAFAPRGFKSFVTSMPIWLRDKLFQKGLLVREIEGVWGKSIKWVDRLLFSEHHMSHAASAFFPSPFERAAVLTMDGVGEWTTTSWAIGIGNSLKVEKEIHFPHSIGLLYSAITYYTGFKVNSGEYKVMGLAPYGKPIYAKLIKDNLIDIQEDGSFHLDMSYFDYCTGLTMTNAKFEKLFGGPPRTPETPITQREMDLAASVQEVIEEVVLRIATAISKETKEKNLCLAGGVALNCVANGKLLKAGLFENIWIQPAAGDAGGAIGAALAAYYIHLNSKRNVPINFDGMSGSYLGPEYSSNEIKAELDSAGAIYEELSYSAMISTAATAIADGCTIGWHQGRSEFGPRALGGRSILADARSSVMQKQLNLQIKYRESFRPFAPSVLSEDKSDWFDLNVDSPYMLVVANVLKGRRLPVDDGKIGLFGIDKLNVERSTIPAVTHVDYSARVQTVSKAINPPYFDLLTKFKELTGCPLVVNTSFNVRGQPIVETPFDAFNCFMATGLDALFIGNFYLKKTQQNSDLIKILRAKLPALND